MQQGLYKRSAQGKQIRQEKSYGMRAHIVVCENKECRIRPVGRVYD